MKEPLDPQAKELRKLRAEAKWLRSVIEYELEEGSLGSKTRERLTNALKKRFR